MFLTNAISFPFLALALATHHRPSTSSAPTFLGSRKRHCDYGQGKGEQRSQGAKRRTVVPSLSSLPPPTLPTSQPSSPPPPLPTPSCRGCCWRPPTLSATTTPLKYTRSKNVQLSCHTFLILIFQLLRGHKLAAWAKMTL